MLSYVIIEGFTFEEIMKLETKKLMRPTMGGRQRLRLTLQVYCYGYESTRRFMYCKCYAATNEYSKIVNLAHTIERYLSFLPNQALLLHLVITLKVNWYIITGKPLVDWPNTNWGSVVMYRFIIFLHIKDTQFVRRKWLRWHKFTYDSPILHWNELRNWLQIFHKHGTKIDRTRSVRPRTWSADTRRIENAFHTDPSMSLRISSDALNLPVSTAHDVYQKFEDVSIQNFFSLGTGTKWLPRRPLICSALSKKDKKWSAILGLIFSLRWVPVSHQLSY